MKRIDLYVYGIHEMSEGEFQHCIDFVLDSLKEWRRNPMQSRREALEHKPLAKGLFFGNE